jgi:16S rRNA (cytosine967-C5)-methyltransferase
MARSVLQGGDRRLGRVNPPTAEPSTHKSQPLAQLLHHAAGAVAAVRAGRSLTEALEAVPGPARPGAQALAFHALRHLGAAQAARERLAPKAPPPALDALLLVALALLWPRADAADGPGYAPHTLVDQAVAASRLYASRSAGFVNAVLRRFLREAEALVAELLADPTVRWNHPRWWIDRLRRDWPGQWEALLEAANRPAPMALRVNARRLDAAGYVERLAAAGLGARAAGAQAVLLERPCPVEELPGFAAGDVSVQDLSAQRAAPLLVSPGLSERARVLDACAAPGGKTAHLLELADLDLLAIDQDPARLERVRRNLDRLGLQARTLAADAARPEAWWDGTAFDAILLDAPCSASGIVRRHPDVRWLRRPSDIAALAQTQDRLLDALWPLLRPGGRLLYATCSVFRDEGSARIDAFLQRQGGARVPREPPSPGHLLGLAHNEPDAPADPGDGFFYTLIEKD